MFFRNTASQKVIFFAFDATTNVPKTGDAANITPYVSKDYGSVTAITDTSATEMDATNAPGYYLVDLTQGETDAEVLLFSAKSSTSNIKVIGAPAVVFPVPTLGVLSPTTKGRTLDVTATGGAGIDWSNVEAPTTSLALTGTTIAVTQKVDVDTIKTNPVVNGGTVTFPSNATLASTTNISSGSIATVTGNVNGNVGGNVTGSVGSLAAQAKADVNAEADTALNDYDGPTNAELATALDTADDAVLAAIAALNNLSQANIRTAVGLGSANLDTQLAAIQADSPNRVTKNTALSGFTFLMVDSADHVTPKTGLTITATRSLDGAAFGACANSASEISNGVYKIDLAAGDLNGNVVMLLFTAVGSDARYILIATQPT